MIPNEWIPLLTKPLSSFTPEDFKLYVKGLKAEPPPKKIRLKKQKPPFVWKMTPKTKKLSLTVNRTPKWISAQEMEDISKDSGVPLNEVFVLLKKKEIALSSEEEQQRIKEQIEEIPWT